MFLNEHKLILLHTVKCFQLLLCITNNSIKHQLFVYSQLNDQTVQSLTIQFSISRLFAHSLNAKQLYLTHRQDPIRCYHSRPERYSAFPQSSSITGASPSDDLVSYLGHSLGESYSFSQMQSVYSTTPADWAKSNWWL